jgi:hypothetical protein
LIRKERVKRKETTGSRKDEREIEKEERKGT